MKFERYLNGTPIMENDDYIIYGDEDLISIKDNLIFELSEAKKEILRFFHIENFQKTTINLFKDRDQYLKFTSQFIESFSYSYGNCVNDMINFNYDETHLSRNFYYLVARIIHEYTHLVYKSICKDKYDRIIWLDEGLAQNLSGEKVLLENNNSEFKSWYLDRIIRRDKELPFIDFLKKDGCNYGEFVDNETNKYDGYDISYLIVRYLKDNYDILSLICNKKKIDEIEENIIPDVINYYNYYFNVDLIPNNFRNINTPEELMDYMNINILYGWIDKNNCEHINTLKEFRENYRTSNIEEILTRKLGTCIEQAKLIKLFFDNKNIETKLFCSRSYECEDNFNQEIKMHCFVLYKLNDKWYHFEHSNQPIRGIYKYDDIENALININNKFKEPGTRVLTEIPSIPDGLNFKQFNEYVNSFDTKKIIK